MNKTTARYQTIKNRNYTDNDFGKIRICIDCNQHLPAKFFYKKPALTDGFDKKCKACRNFLTNDLEKRPEVRERRKDQYYSRVYGISLVETENLIKSVGNKCEICDTPQEKLKRKLHIDHCHVTNKIRGVLCDNCNKSLGLMRDSITVLSKAVNYLKRSNNNG